MERVVRRISRPVLGIGIKSPNKEWKAESNHFLLSENHQKLNRYLLCYGVVVGGVVVGAVVAGDVVVSGKGKMN